jgi:hypothetical protein
MCYQLVNAHAQAFELNDNRNLTTVDQDRSPMILYGISTCDTCKRALKTLQPPGKDVTFRDIRASR